MEENTKDSTLKEKRDKLKAKRAKYKEIKPYGEAEIENHAPRVGGRHNLKEINIYLDDEEMKFSYLVKKPSRAVVQATGEAGSKKDQAKTQKIMIGCVLEGDKDAYEYDGSIYLRLIEEIGVLFEKAKSDIAKI